MSSDSNLPLPLCPNPRCLSVFDCDDDLRAHLESSRCADFIDDRYLPSNLSNPKFQDLLGSNIRSPIGIADESLITIFRGNLDLLLGFNTVANSTDQRGFGNLQDAGGYLSISSNICDTDVSADEDFTEFIDYGEILDTTDENTAETCQIYFGSDTNIMHISQYHCGIDPNHSTATGECGGEFGDEGVDTGCENFLDILQSHSDLGTNTTHLPGQLGDSNIDIEIDGVLNGYFNQLVAYNVQTLPDFDINSTVPFEEDDSDMNFMYNGENLQEPETDFGLPPDLLSQAYSILWPNNSELSGIVSTGSIGEITEGLLASEFDVPAGQTSPLPQSSTNDASTNDTPQMSNTSIVITNPVPYSKCPDCKKKKKRCRLHVTSVKKERRVSPGKACVWCNNSNKKCLGNVPCSLCDQLGRTCLGNGTQSTATITDLCNKLDDSDEDIRKMAVRSLFELISGTNGCHDRYNLNPYLEILKEHNGIRKINNVLNREHWLFRRECGHAILYFRDLKDKNIDIDTGKTDPSTLQYTTDEHTHIEDHGIAARGSVKELELPPIAIGSEHGDENTSHIKLPHLKGCISYLLN